MKTNSSIEFEDVKEVVKKTRHGISSIVTGNKNFTTQARKYFGFILFLALLGFLYISNHNWLDNMAKEKLKLSEEVRNLKEEAIVTGARLTGMYCQVSVTREVEVRGLKLSESVCPPTILKSGKRE